MGQFCFAMGIREWARLIFGKGGEPREWEGKGKC